MKNFGNNSNSPSHVRKAAVTAMVLVVLVLMAGMIAEFVRRAASDRRQTRRDMHYQQTINLADAGIERVLQLRRVSEDYTGETWEIPAGNIHQTNTAQVKITIDDDVATIVARYPVNIEMPNQVTRTIRLSEQANP